MKVEEALHGVGVLLLDTAPVIYYVERHPLYFPVVDFVFESIEEGRIAAVTSPVTLAECLVMPYRQSNNALAQDFEKPIIFGKNTEFTLIGRSVGQRAAEIRAQYNISLPDALQVAVALESGCDALLTNDTGLSRITEIRVLVVDTLEA